MRSHSLCKPLLDGTIDSFLYSLNFSCDFVTVQSQDFDFLRAAPPTRFGRAPSMCVADGSVVPFHFTLSFELLFAVSVPLPAFAPILPAFRHRVLSDYLTLFPP